MVSHRPCIPDVAAVPRTARRRPAAETPPPLGAPMAVQPAVQFARLWLSLGILLAVDWGVHISFVGFCRGFGSEYCHGYVLCVRRRPVVSHCSQRPSNCRRHYLDRVFSLLDSCSVVTRQRTSKSMPIEIAKINFYKLASTRSRRANKSSSGVTVAMNPPHPARTKEPQFASAP